MVVGVEPGVGAPWDLVKNFTHNLDRCSERCYGLGMEFSPHDTMIYCLEMVVIEEAGARPISLSTAQGLAAKVMGHQVRFSKLTQGQLDAGVLAAARWDNGVARIAYCDEWLNDITIAHELAHLVADRDGQTGHGIEWLGAYGKILRQFHRPDVAHVMVRTLGHRAARNPSMGQAVV